LREEAEAVLGDAPAVALESLGPSDRITLLLEAHAVRLMAGAATSARNHTRVAEATEQMERIANRMAASLGEDHKDTQTHYQLAKQFMTKLPRS
jgi:hypothetical protein